MELDAPFDVGDVGDVGKSDERFCLGCHVISKAIQGP